MTTTKEKIVLTDKLIVSSRGKLCDRYYRAVLIEDDKDDVCDEVAVEKGKDVEGGGRDDRVSCPKFLALAGNSRFLERSTSLSLANVRLFP